MTGVTVLNSDSMEPQFHWTRWLRARHTVAYLNGIVHSDSEGEQHGRCHAGLEDRRTCTRVGQVPLFACIGAFSLANSRITSPLPVLAHSLSHVPHQWPISIYSL